MKKILEQFQMKPIVILVEKALTLSLDQYPKTDDANEKISNVPYPTAI